MAGINGVQLRSSGLKLDFGSWEKNSSTAAVPAVTVSVWELQALSQLHGFPLEGSRHGRHHTPTRSDLHQCFKFVTSNILFQDQLTRMPEMKGSPVGTFFLYSTQSSAKKWMRESSSSSIRSRKNRQLAIVQPNIHTGLHSMICKSQQNRACGKPKGSKPH